MKVVMEMKRRRLVGDCVKLEILSVGEGEKVVIMLDLGNDVGCILNYCDTEKEALEISDHFALCCKVATDEGFSGIPGFFVHGKIGCGLRMAEGLILGEPPSVFRRKLRQLKSGQYMSRNQGHEPSNKK